MPDRENTILISDVSRETLAVAEALFEQNHDSFSRLVDCWNRWNKTVNLFSKKTKRSDLEKHIVHSLLLNGITKRRDCNLILDAGTGGGLPGLPLAIIRRDKNFLLVDKVQKKCLVIRDIVRALDLPNVRALHSDLADADVRSPFRIVSKHAFPVKTILKAAAGKNWTEIAMLKGDNVLSETDRVLMESYVISFHRFNNFGDPFFDNRGVLLVHRKTAGRE